MNYVYVLRSVRDDGFYVGYSFEFANTIATALGRKFICDRWSTFPSVTTQELPQKTSLERSRVSAAFTRYTHVLNRPGIGVKSPLD